MTKIYKLPIDYTKLHWKEKRIVREQYIQQQEHKCIYCKCSLQESAPKEITDKEIDWNLFPPDFLKHPVHLQHCHKIGMTEGAVHAYCNAVSWQYDGK